MALRRPHAAKSRVAGLAIAALASGCAALPAGPAPALRALAGAPHIRYAPGMERRAQAIARLLPAAETDVAQALGQPWRGRVKVFVCGAPACMTGLGTRAGWHAVSTRRGVIFGPGAFGPGVDLGRLIRHELVHAHFRQHLGRRYWQVPAWFHEGLAVVISGNGAEGVSPAAAWRQMARGNHFTFYCRRDPAGFSRGFRPGRTLYYRQAALFVRHIRATSESRFRQFIAAVLRGADLCRSYVGVYGKNLRSVWSAFRRRS